MKRNVLTFGAITGAILSSQMLFMVSMCYDPNWEPNDFVGYLAMIMAFSLTFVGIKKYRDQHNDGVISFGRALLVGVNIVLVASVIYIVIWLVDYYLFVPDFLDHYSAQIIRRTAAEGGDTQAMAVQMERFKQWYKNPIFVVLITFAEIFPVGLIVSIVSAFILRRRTPREMSTTA